jgi:hypothetical protein
MNGDDFASQKRKKQKSKSWLSDVQILEGIRNLEDFQKV